MEKIWTCAADNMLIAPPTNPRTHVGWAAIKRNWESYWPTFDKFKVSLHIALGGLPDGMSVEIDSGIALSARTVRTLRKVSVWPDNLVITTPQDRSPENTVKVSKVSLATRVSPKQ
jgi:hypothetical protein